MSSSHSNRARQVGWFGGSFDPVHRAHLALAHAALDQLALDEVRWIVAGQPWQKSGRRMAGAAHRAEMVRLTIAGEGGDPRFVVDDREIRRAGPSYTLDSVREYQQERPGDALWLILGQDQLAGFPSWNGWEELVERMHKRRDRDFGVGYGSSSGYGSGKTYVRAWRPGMFSFR